MGTFLQMIVRTVHACMYMCASCLYVWTYVYAWAHVNKHTEKNKEWLTDTKNGRLRNSNYLHASGLFKCKSQYKGCVAEGWQLHCLHQRVGTATTRSLGLFQN
jgi:hypothetical protein